MCSLAPLFTSSLTGADYGVREVKVWNCALAIPRAVAPHAVNAVVRATNFSRDVCEGKAGKQLLLSQTIPAMS